jgi:hypothetical protein
MKMISMSWFGAPVVVLALLAHPGPARSESGAGPATPAASDPPRAEAPGSDAGDPAATPAPVEPRAALNPRPRKPRRGGIDARVRLLTAELQLDAKQQELVRRILEEQRAATLKAWSDESVPSAVRVKSTQVVAEQTADRIRAILNDQQRERYIKPVPLEARATPNAPDLDGYLKGTQRK